MADNLRHAQYGSDGVQIDDPQKLTAAIRKSIRTSSGILPQSTRIGICGTSITEPRTYRVATGATQNADGTWTITFASNPRPNFGEGEYVQVSQGPAGVNTRKALCLAISGNTLTVRPDISLSLPLVGTAPLVYQSQSNQPNSYIAQLRNLSKNNLQITVDATLGGASTQELLQILQRDLLSRESEVDLFIAEIGAMNGIYARNNSYAIELAYCQEYIKRVADVGKLFVIVGCCPRASTAAGWTAGKRDDVLKINAMCRKLTESLGGIWIDPYKASFGDNSYLDVTNANSNPLTNATTDGVHPSATAGAEILGGYCADKLDKILPEVDLTPESISSLVSSGLLNSNPFLTGTGGAKTGGAGATVTGNVADGCDIVVTAGGADLTITCSLVQTTNTIHGTSRGFAQRLVISTVGTAASIIEFRFGGDMKANVTNGDQIYGVAGVIASRGATPQSGTPVKLAGTSMVINAQTATTINNLIDSNGQGATSTVSCAASKKVLQTNVGMVRAPASIHGAPSLLRAAVWIIVGSASDVCVEIFNPGCYKAITPN